MKLEWCSDFLVTSKFCQVNIFIVIVVLIVISLILGKGQPQQIQV